MPPLAPAVAHLHPHSLARHPLPDHLLASAELARLFADDFAAGAWAYHAALWHDLGKYREAFQRYLRQSQNPDAHLENRVRDADKTHSAAGALWAQQSLSERDPRLGPYQARLLGYLIAGHHAGLYDGEELTAKLAQSDRKREGREALAANIPAAIPDNILHPPLALPSPTTLPLDQNTPDAIPGRLALWLRLVFSCVVDADFLDTEAFMAPDKADQRQGFASLTQLENQLTEHLDQLTAKAPSTPVNRHRAAILAACRDQAAQPPGVFSLSVPTGGGKTLASLAFALRHATQHGQRRIIYAIPYTSIIEQTASICRHIFGAANVVEHHSSLDLDDRQETARSRLASENWDAPLIVTTNVQLLESLFASRTSRCRKLHNLVGSVIVLDEAQLLPVDFLQPVIDVLRLLVRDYRVTLLLCTATQPALDSRTGFDHARALRGFAPGEVREIIADVPALYAALERVRYHLPADLDTPQDWPTTAASLSQHEAALAIVSRRADARALYQQLRPQLTGSLWHLSGLMCAQHRSHVISAIKQALSERRQQLAQGNAAPTVHVVSTQLIEAGVDLDFPVVYRALAGLDSIAQAAGRCNREGLLDRGDVHLFVPPTLPPPGLLRQAANVSKRLWKALPAGAHPLHVDLCRAYFQHLYADTPLDRHGISQLLRLSGPDLSLPFRTVAQRFRLIDDADSATVFVRYQQHPDDHAFDQLVQDLQARGPERPLLRRLQRYGVTIYDRDRQRLLDQGDIVPLPGDCPGLYLQSPDNHLLYHPDFGLNVDGAPGDPGGLVL